MRSARTPETSAILCWLRSRDQLGKRQDAKCFLSFSVYFTLFPSFILQTHVLPIWLTSSWHFGLILLFHMFLIMRHHCHLYRHRSLCAWRCEPSLFPKHVPVSSQCNKAVIHTSCQLIQASLKRKKRKNKMGKKAAKTKARFSGWKANATSDKIKSMLHYVGKKRCGQLSNILLWV